MEKKTTKAEQALLLMEKKGLTVIQAAREMEISESAVHAARRRKTAAESGRCASCGGPVDADGRHKASKRK